MIKECSMCGRSIEQHTSPCTSGDYAVQKQNDDLLDKVKDLIFTLSCIRFASNVMSRAYVAPTPIV